MSVKNFLKKALIGGLIVATYGSFFSHFDKSFINSFSQKRPYTYAIDYEAYNKTEPLGINIQDNLEEKVIANWDSSWGQYYILSWFNDSFSNTLGFTPYYGNLAESDDPLELLQKEEVYLEFFLKTAYQKAETTLLRIKGNEKSYEKLKLENPLDYLSQRMARYAVDFTNKVVIELEAPDNGDYEAHNRRIEKIREISPKYRIATTLDKKEGYNSETGLWDAEKSREYWKNSDIIILQDYFSTPENLEKSIKDFKKTAKGKKIWVRVVTGTERINERDIKSLEEELEEYEQLMKVTKKYADGCIANDSNGIWLYSKESYDKNERMDRTKFLYKQFRGIKID